MEDKEEIGNKIFSDEEQRKFVWKSRHCPFPDDWEYELKVNFCTEDE